VQRIVEKAVAQFSLTDGSFTVGGGARNLAELKQTFGRVDYVPLAKGDFDLTPPDEIEAMIATVGKAGGRASARPQLCRLRWSQINLDIASLLRHA
jgi:hypothetical protein